MRVLLGIGGCVAIIAASPWLADAAGPAGMGVVALCGLSAGAFLGLAIRRRHP